MRSMGNSSPPKKPRSFLTNLIIRLMVCAAIATVTVFAISEAAFRLQKDSIVREPQTIELVIPAGTAELVAAGGEVPSIPEEMRFLQGDVLLVKNQDNVDHQLGPVWVPPNGNARLSLKKVENILLSCSFAPSNYLGIDVRQPTTWFTRATALALAVPPTTMFLLVYSLVLFPFNKQPVPGESPRPEPASDSDLEPNDESPNSDQELRAWPEVRN